MLQLPIYQLPNNLNKFSMLDVVGSFINLKPEMAWLVAGLAGLLFVVVSFVLAYHWKRFGLERMVMSRVSFIYFSVSSILISIMVVSLAFYINSL